MEVSRITGIMMDKIDDTTTADLRAVLAALQVQLAKLDRMGAAIPAIHLDASIQELRKVIRLPAE
ncbi:MAG: hypothetical protein AAGK17_10070 [Pseudomonadota bacterium]